VTLEHRRVDLKRLGRQLGARKGLSFASAERLMEVLGVRPGAVTPFAVINDRGSRVNVVLDRGMLELDPLNYHPLTNDRTTAISPTDLSRFLVACRHMPTLIDL
jgi:Ala-tRNA(Pro) deacylase